MELSSKAYIVHDASGEIVSVGRVPKNLRGRLEVRSGDAGHSVLEVELDAQQAAMSLADLHNRHKVHVPTKKLIRK